MAMHRAPCVRIFVLFTHVTMLCLCMQRLRGPEMTAQMLLVEDP